MRFTLIALCGVGAFLVLVLCHVWRMRRWGEDVSVFFDADNPDPAFLADCWAAVARQLDARPRRLRLCVRTERPLDVPVTMDWDTDGRIVIDVEGRPPATLDVRRRWIPDHPVPLPLRPRFLPRRRGVRVRLYVDPVDANRFRVMSRLPQPSFLWVGVACSLLATVGVVFLIPELLALALGTMAGRAFVRVL